MTDVTPPVIEWTWDAFDHMWAGQWKKYQFEIETAHRVRDGLALTVYEEETETSFRVLAPTVEDLKAYAARFVAPIILWTNDDAEEEWMGTCGSAVLTVEPQRVTASGAPIAHPSKGRPAFARVQCWLQTFTHMPPNYEHALAWAELHGRRYNAMSGGSALTLPARSE